MAQNAARKTTPSFDDRPEPLDLESSLHRALSDFDLRCSARSPSAPSARHRMRRDQPIGQVRAESARTTGPVR
ncbi:MAG TPA: hypothetical protein VEB21_15245 [Terriglobales bacterium]|nr:hypothetical protein [Terriglobales bacterium]